MNYTLKYIEEVLYSWHENNTNVIENNRKMSSQIIRLKSFIISMCNYSAEVVGETLNGMDTTNC